MTATLHDRYVAALEKHGFKKVDTVGKYTRLIRDGITMNGIPTFCFVGPAGAVRKGSCTSTSVPCGSAFKTKLLASV